MATDLMRSPWRGANPAPRSPMDDIVDDLKMRKQYQDVIGIHALFPPASDQQLIRVDLKHGVSVTYEMNILDVVPEDLSPWLPR